MLNENSGITVEDVTITPELAGYLLTRNTHNRNVKRTNLQKVIRALENGEWAFNGEAIKIAQDGRILDGQHRLHAIVETGIPMRTLVIKGLESETQETMDGGSPRSAADVLKLRGEINATGLAAIAKKICIYETFGLKQAFTNSNVITTPEIVRCVDRNPGIREFVQAAARVNGSTRMAVSVAGFLMHILYMIDPVDAEFFFDRLESGEMLSKGDPIYELRKSLELVHSTRGTKSMVYIGAISIKAWNKYRDGEQCGLLRFTTGGANPETFPEPK